MEVHLEGLEFFHVDRQTDRHIDGRTDRQTDVKKLIVAFCNFAKAPKILSRRLLFFF